MTQQIHSWATDPKELKSVEQIVLQLHPQCNYLQQSNGSDIPIVHWQMDG